MKVRFLACFFPAKILQSRDPKLLVLGVSAVIKVQVVIKPRSVYGKKLFTSVFDLSEHKNDLRVLQQWCIILIITFKTDSELRHFHTHRPLPHSGSVSTNHETRLRPWWTVQYKSLYPVPKP